MWYRNIVSGQETEVNLVTPLTGYKVTVDHWPLSNLSKLACVIAWGKVKVEVLLCTQYERQFGGQWCWVLGAGMLGMKVGGAWVLGMKVRRAWMLGMKVGRAWMLGCWV